MVGCEGIDHMTLEPLTDTFTPRGRAMVSKLRVAVDGAFKTPTVRNVGLTAPYFHNGGYKNLEELVEFYNRGGNRRGDFQISQDGRAKNKMPKFDRGLKGDTSGSGWLVARWLRIPRMLPRKLRKAVTWMPTLYR